MMDSVIRNPNTSNLSSLYSLYQCFPGSEPTLFTSVRGMDEIEVDIVQSSLLKRLIDVPFGVLVVQTTRWNFACEENVFTGNTLFFYKLVNSCYSRSFITICNSAVDVTITCLQRMLNN